MVASSTPLLFKPLSNFEILYNDFFFYLNGEHRLGCQRYTIQQLNEDPDFAPHELDEREVVEQNVMYLCLLRTKCLPLSRMVALHQKKKQADRVASARVRRQDAAVAWCVSTEMNEQMTHIIR